MGRHKCDKLSPSEDRDYHRRAQERILTVGIWTIGGMFVIFVIGLIVILVKY